MNGEKFSALNLAKQKSVLGYPLFLLYSIALLVFSCTKGIGAEYLFPFAVVLFLCSLMYLGTARLNGDNLIAFPLAIIIMTGSYLQIYLAFESDILSSSVKSYIMYILIGLGAFFVALFFMTKKKNVICFLYSFRCAHILLAVSCVLYLLTIIWNMVGGGGNTGQVKNWISVMGVSVQITDLTRLLYVWSLAISAKRMNNVKWLRFIVLSYLINVVLLVVASELGFVILISIVTAIVFLLYIDNLSVIKKAFGKWLKPIGIGIGVIVVLVVLLHKFLYNLMLQSGTGARVIERFSLFLDPENASSDLSYQYDLVKTAIYNGGLLGNRNLTAVVPVGESDLIFANIIQYFGLLIGIIIIFLLAIFYMHLLRACNKTTQSSVGQVFVLSLFSQTLFNIGATIGVFPLAGVTLPFLSLGGTSFVLSFLSVGIILGAASLNYPYLEYESIGKEDESSGDKAGKKISDIVDDADLGGSRDSDSIDRESGSHSRTFKSSRSRQRKNTSKRKTGEHDFWDDL